MNLQTRVDKLEQRATGGEVIRIALDNGDGMITWAGEQLTREQFDRRLAELPAGSPVIIMDI